MGTLKPQPKRKRSITAFISPSKEILRSPSKQRSVSEIGEEEEPDTLEEDMRAYLDLQLELAQAMRATFSQAGKLPGLSTKVMETIPRGRYWRYGRRTGYSGERQFEEVPSRW